MCMVSVVSCRTYRVSVVKSFLMSMVSVVRGCTSMVSVVRYWTFMVSVVRCWTSIVSC